MILHGRGFSAVAAIGALTFIVSPAHATGRDAWLTRVEMSRQRCAAFIGAAVERRGRLGRVDVSRADFATNRNFMDDPTLRYGDIIVRADRLVVFRGASGEERSASDFRDLVRERMGGVHDHELRALDAIVRIPAASD